MAQYGLFVLKVPLNPNQPTNPGEPGLAGVYEAKDDGGGGDNWTTGAISRANLQSNHQQQTNIQIFLQAGCPSCHPTNSVKALKWKYHIPWTCLLQAHLGSSNFVTDH